MADPKITDQMLIGMLLIISINPGLLLRLNTGLSCGPRGIRCEAVINWQPVSNNRPQNREGPSTAAVC